MCPSDVLYMYLEWWEPAGGKDPFGPSVYMYIIGHCPTFFLVYIYMYVYTTSGDVMYIYGIAIDVHPGMTSHPSFLLKTSACGLGVIHHVGFKFCFFFVLFFSAQFRTMTWDIMYFLKIDLRHGNFTAIQVLIKIRTLCLL